MAKFDRSIFWDGVEWKEGLNFRSNLKKFCNTSVVLEYLRKVREIVYFI